MEVVTLLSGGLDSSLLTCLLEEERITQFPLFIDYGQLNIKKETVASRNTCKNLGLSQPEIMQVNGFGKVIESGITSRLLDVNLDAFLPNRNALFLLLASSYAYKMKCSHIAIGILNEKECIFPDQTRSFLDAMENLIELSLGKRITILSPFINLNKSEIIALANKKGVSDTYSCHLGGDNPCGKCISCLEFENSKINNHR